LLVQVKAKGADPVCWRISQPDSNHNAAAPLTPTIATSAGIRRRRRRA